MIETSGVFYWVHIAYMEKKILPFCLQFSISLVCGIEQIVEHDSPFHMYV